MIFHSHVQHFSTSSENVSEFGLSVCSSDCSRLSSRKYSSKILRDAYTVHRKHTGESKVVECTVKSIK